MVRAGQSATARSYTEKFLRHAIDAPHGKRMGEARHLHDTAARNLFPCIENHV